MLTYLPSDFWGVALTRTGSALPHVILRSVGMCIPALISAFMMQFRDFFEADWWRSGGGTNSFLQAVKIAQAQAAAGASAPAAEAGADSASSGGASGLRDHEPAPPPVPNSSASDLQDSAMRFAALAKGSSKAVQGASPDGSQSSV